MGVNFSSITSRISDICGSADEVEAHEMPTLGAHTSAQPTPHQPPTVGTQAPPPSSSHFPGTLDLQNPPSSLGGTRARSASEPLPVRSDPYGEAVHTSPPRNQDLSVRTDVQPRGAAAEQQPSPVDFDYEAYYREYEGRSMTSREAAMSRGELPPPTIYGTLESTLRKKMSPDALLGNTRAKMGAAALTPMHYASKTLHLKPAIEAVRGSIRGGSRSRLELPSPGARSQGSFHETASAGASSLESRRRDLTERMQSAEARLNDAVEAGHDTTELEELLSRLERALDKLPEQPGGPGPGGPSGT
jgi:hypothetical protein